jgi:hypothetical protein
VSHCGGAKRRCRNFDHDAIVEDDRLGGLVDHLMRGTAFNKPATKRKIERAWGIFAAMTAGHVKYM